MRLPLFMVLFSILFLTGCTGVPKGLHPVTGFQPTEYLGTWYEIARLDHSFERGLTHVTAAYSQPEEGGAIRVVNRGYDPKDEEWREANGKARFKGSEDVASLSVMFFWPFAGGYHVIALDKENYQWAMVAGPTRDYLWILARDPSLDTETLNRLVDQARDGGFDVDKLIYVDQSQPPPGCCVIASATTNSKLSGDSSASQ